MFHGEDEHTMDARGRVFIPAKHREELGEEVFLMRGIDGQINVYPESIWRDMTDRLTQANQSRSATRNTRRYVFSTDSTPLDRQGRILIPNRLRRYADLGGDVVISGNEDHIEIWNSERYEENWDRVLAQMRESRDDPEKVDELGLNI
jgi:MraZ protein